MWVSQAGVLCMSSSLFAIHFSVPYLCFLQTNRHSTATTEQPSIYTRPFLLRTKQPKHETEQSSLSITMVYYAWRFTFMPLHTFMIWCLGTGTTLPSLTTKFHLPTIFPLMHNIHHPCYCHYHKTHSKTVNCVAMA
jgi:hypothetical protein